MEWLYEILKKSNTCLSRTLHTYHKMGAFINNPKIKLTILWLTMDSALEKIPFLEEKYPKEFAYLIEQCFSKTLSVFGNI